MNNFSKIVITILLILILASFTFAGSLLTQKTTIRGIERTYLVYLPTGFDATKTYPLVYMFHGMGSDATFAASDYYNIKGLADSKGFIAVFPDSLKNLPPKNFSFLWVNIPEYDVAGFPGNQKYIRWDIGHIQASNKCDSQDLDFVSNILTKLSTDYKVSADHVYFMGHSYGALFSYYASMCLPSKVTAFAGHSGGLVNYYNMFYFPIAATNAKTNAALKVPGLLIHSTDDSVVPYSWDQKLQTELTNKGHPNQLISLTGMGHNYDKTKNESIWTFFINNSTPLPQQIACSTNLECGTNTDSANYCSTNALKKDTLVNTCVNPGTTASYCKKETVTNLVQQCSSSQLCESSQCKDIACFANTDCGVDSFIGNNFCSENNVFKQKETFTCNNPGTTSSSCSKNTGNILMESCSPTQECFSGECKKISCFLNTDCGADALVGENYCQNNDVYKKKQMFSCNDAGKWTSSCSNNLVDTLVEDCEYGCEAGACVVPKCFSNTDCGTESWTSSNFCSENNVLKTKDIPTCENPGTLLANCVVKTENVLQETCSNSCYEGSCFVPSCTLDLDCGAPSESANYCKSGNVYKEITSFGCLNPGLFNSSCQSNKNEILVKTCEFGCESSECIVKIVSSWEAKFLASLLDYSGVVWKNSGKWSVSFDYGSNGIINQSFFDYPTYNILSIDVEQKIPSLWWGLWTGPNGSLGLYRQDAYGGNKLIKSLFSTTNRYPVYMSLLGSNPLILYQNLQNKAVIIKFNNKAQNIGSTTIALPDSSWKLLRLVTNHTDKVAVLLTNNTEFKVWELNSSLAKTNEYTFPIPEGYSLADLEVGYALLDGSDALILDVYSGTEYNIPTNGLDASDLEIRADGKLLVLTSNSYGEAQVLTVSNGIVESTTNYAAPN
ncbi:MAG: hypothetical protein PHH82_03990 [Candidatus ainarchaeum sp.]|nr:hypothetical protein [Candidatus ainarchaeum sp.]